MSKKSLPAEPEGWAKIDSRCKPSKATATDGWKPALQNGFVSHEKDGSYLCATDSYILVRLPIQLTGKTVKAREAELPGGPLRPQVLKALDRSRTGYFRIKDGCAEVFGEPMLYPTPEPTDKFPDTRSLVDGAGKANGGVAEIALNPALVRRVAEALGAGKGIGLKLRLTDRHKPVVVEATGLDGVGLVMPIRMNV